MATPCTRASIKRLLSDSGLQRTAISRQLSPVAALSAPRTVVTVWFEAAGTQMSFCANIPDVAIKRQPGWRVRPVPPHRRTSFQKARFHDKTIAALSPVRVRGVHCNPGRRPPLGNSDASNILSDTGCPRLRARFMAWALGTLPGYPLFRTAARRRLGRACASGLSLLR